MKVVGEVSEYEFSNGTLLVDGKALRFDDLLAAITSASRKNVQENYTLKDRMKLTRGTGVLPLPDGNLASDDFHAFAYDIEKLRSALTTLSDDLYLKSQLGVVSLSFAETMKMLKKEYGYNQFSLEFNFEGRALTVVRSYVESVGHGNSGEKSMLVTLLGKGSTSPWNIEYAMKHFVSQSLAKRTDLWPTKGAGVLRINGDLESVDFLNGSSDSAICLATELFEECLPRLEQSFAESFLERPPAVRSVLKKSLKTSSSSLKV